jgi:hypothetical protein
MMEDEAEAWRDRSAQTRTEEALGRLDPAEVAQAVAAFARENPHVALAAAASLGFLLGGGLTPRLLGTLGLMATRGYLRGTVAQLLDVVAEQLQPQDQSG